jgi:membrane peptidoglycan carboxypeptidase
MLVAVAQAPVTDDPFAHRANARAGEAIVLDQLAATGKLTSAQQERALDQPLGLAKGHHRRAPC